MPEPGLTASFNDIITNVATSELALMQPAAVSYGVAKTVKTARQTELSKAYDDQPERFVNEPPAAAMPPESAWINTPIAYPESHDTLASGANLSHSET